MSVPQRSRHQFQYQELAEGLVVPAPPSVPAMSWAPRYPDMVMGRTSLPVAVIAAFFFGPLGPPPVPAMSWKPEYPDIVAVRARSAPTESFSYAYQVPAAEVPRMSWAPTYPDTVPGRRPLTPSPSLFFDIEPIIVPVPKFSWNPSYPSAVGRSAAGLATANQQFLAWAPELIVPAEPNIGGWGPHYPPFPPIRRRPLPVSALTEFAWVGLQAYPGFTSYASPFSFDASNWRPDAMFYLEVYARATVGTVFAGVANETDGVPISGSVVLTSSTSFVRLRSGPFSLSTGTYRLRFGKIAGDSGEALSARIVSVS